MVIIKQSAKSRFCFLFSILSILNGYSFGYASGFSIAMIISSIYALWSLLLMIKSLNCNFNYKNTYFKYNYDLIKIVLIYIVISSISLLIYSGNIIYKDIIYDIVKIAVWAVFLSFAGYFYFDLKIFVKYMANVAVIVTIYIFIQYILFYAFHLSIPNGFDLGIIKPYDDNYRYIFSASKSYFRPGSFWVEPAFYGYYINCFLALCLFNPNLITSVTNYKIKFLLIFMCIGILLSMSTGAIGIMIILISINIIKKTKKVAVIGISAIILLYVIGYVFIQYELYEYMGTFGENIAQSVYKIQNLNTNGRTGDSFELLNNLQGLQRILGIGIGNDSQIVYLSNAQYMNSIVTIIVWTGYVGICIFGLYMLSLYKRNKGNLWLTVLLLIFIIDGAFSAIYFGAHSFVYLMLILYGNRDHVTINYQNARATPHKGKRGVATSDFSSGETKTAANTGCICEDFCEV